MQIEINCLHTFTSKGISSVPRSEVWARKSTQSFLNISLDNLNLSINNKSGISPIFSKHRRETFLWWRLSHISSQRAAQKSLRECIFKSVIILWTQPNTTQHFNRWSNNRHLVCSKRYLQGLGVRFISDHSFAIRLSKVPLGYGFVWSKSSYSDDSFNE